jgi:SAM-dependent methyltransferase
MAYNAINGEIRQDVLREVAKGTGISETRLAAVYSLEKDFHWKIISEKNFDTRKKMYSELYNSVHQILCEDWEVDLVDRSKDRLVRLFRRELAGKSIADLGCGDGSFLTSVERHLPHGRLVGVDVSETRPRYNAENIDYAAANIVDFDLGEQYDVVFSDNALEHIAPSDIDTHFASVRKALRAGGTFIIISPNRLFGPNDLTRLSDCTHSNRVEACACHLSETTYSEIVDRLRGAGFRKIKTVLPTWKLRYLFPDVRLSTRFFMAIESSPSLLRLMYSVRRNNDCVFRLGIVLICRV